MRTVGEEPPRPMASDWNRPFVRVPLDVAPMTKLSMFVAATLLPMATAPGLLVSALDPRAICVALPVALELAPATTLPAQLRLPVAPSTVQPVAPKPPARFTLDAVAPTGPTFSVLAAPAKFTVVAVVFAGSKEAEPATSEVVIVGLVPKT